MYKCLVCKFECPDLKQHVKSEWHIYNLRRETVGLKSITYEDFKAKQNELISINQIIPPKDYHCCNKVFKSSNTYENHLKSKKHLEKSSKDVNLKAESESINESEIEEGMIVEYIEESESEEDEKVVKPLSIVDCFYCNVSSDTVEKNLDHMKKKHKFNLPYPDYISNLDGLMEYLTSLVDEYNVCFQCNKQFDDRHSVRNHMLDLNHMQLYFHLESNGDDLADFYSDLPRPVSNLGDSIGNDMQVEAVLPNGKRIGNRNMKVYFKQNLNGLSNTNRLAITSGVDKAKMSLVKCGKYGQLAKPVTMTPQEKKYKTLEARYIQLRNSRYSNFQQHFRLQILM